MAYSSSFNLDPEDRERFAPEARDRSMDRSGRLPSDQRSSRSSRSFDDMNGDRRSTTASSRSQAPRTTNRITVNSRPLTSAERRSRPVGNRTSERTSGNSQRVRTSRASERIPERDRGRRTGQQRSQGKRGPQSHAAIQGQPKRSKQPKQPQQLPQQTYAPHTSDSVLEMIFNVFKAILMGIVKVILLIGKGIGHGFAWVWSKNKIVGGVIVIALVLVCGFAVDTLATGDRIYKGVYVGDVDLAGKTESEAAEAITARYGDKLAQTSVYIFKSEEAAKDTGAEEALKQQEALAEQTSVQETLENKVLWIETADSLGAKLPVEDLAREAAQFGRSTGLFDRFSTLMGTHVIPPRIDYNQIILSKLISDLDTAIGDPIKEYGISMEDGVASVVEGHDGYMIDEDTFVATLTDKLLNSEVDDPRYIPVADYTPLKVDGESAARTADAINQALSEGASFSYDSESAEISKETLASWIVAEPAKRGDAWFLKPQVSESKALETLTKDLTLAQNGQNYKVTFAVEDEDVIVRPDQPVTVPTVSGALDDLDQVLFGSFWESGEQKVVGDRYNIPIQTEQTDQPLSLDAALAYGVVTKFSTFTTEFNQASTTANRLYNIQKVADLLDDSIVRPGGTWSFNEIAGDCNAEAGFKDANVIAGDEMVQEAGGGVCQVATTVFNAVYDSGLPISERHNHSMRSGSYPDGLDAAIAFPTLDLRWENGTDSDILLTTSYTSYSVTVDLIGEDPHLTVTTDTGEWQEGDPYKVKVEVDDTYADTAVVKMTNGSDGSKINVVRTVTDESGNQVEQKTFSSVYSPINVVVKVGPKVDIAEIQRKYARPDEDGSDQDQSGSSSSSASSSQSSSQQ